MDNTSTSLPPDIVPSDSESIAVSTIPWNRDDARAQYLGLRASGFKLREALALIGKAKSTLSLWRHDPVFVNLENKIPELRSTLALEYANLEFLRNYRLILEKDYRVLKSSLQKKVDADGKPTSMDGQDFQYLLKMRAHYTPQQLQVIEQLMSDSKSGGKVFNLTDFVVTATRAVEQVRIETRHRQEPELSPVFEGEITDGETTNDPEGDKGGEAQHKESSGEPNPDEGASTGRPSATSKET